MAWHRISDKPLSEPILTQSTDAYVALGGDELIVNESYQSWKSRDIGTGRHAGTTGLKTSRGPFYSHGLTLIPAWISNYIHYKVWNEITYPFLNFNSATVEV